MIRAVAETVLLACIATLVAGCYPARPSAPIEKAGGGYGAMVTGPPRIDFFDGPDLSDEKLKAIAPDLAADHRWVELSLDNTNVTDASIETILALPQIRMLRVSGTAVTSRGIASVTADRRIIFIGATPLQITPDQRDELQKRRPDLEVWRYFNSNEKAKTSLQNLQTVIAEPHEDKWVKADCERMIAEKFYLP